MTKKYANRIVGSGIMNPADIKANPQNWRKHPASQGKALDEVLGSVGWIQEVIINKTTGNLIDGHLRVETALKNKETEIPVKYVELTEDEERIALATFDPISAMAEQDADMLKQLLADIESEDVDMTQFFDEDVLPKIEHTEEELEAVPEVPKVAKTKRGDMYQLGEHVLMCGDSTVEEDVRKLMQGELADMVFTDPPYNVAGESKNYAADAPTQKAYKNLRDAEWDKGFNIALLLTRIEEIMAKDSSVYICTSHFLAPNIWRWMEGWADHYSYCIWCKPNPMPSLSKRHWTWNTELICYATRGKHIFNFPEEGHALSTWIINKRNGKSGHPTEKPVEVPKHSITHSSLKGQIVLDLFGGSGSTLIACEETGRKCRMMELAPEYCDVIVERWEKLTGKKAELISGE